MTEERLLQIEEYVSEYGATYSADMSEDKAIPHYDKWASYIIELVTYIYELKTELSSLSKLEAIHRKVEWKFIASLYRRLELSEGALRELDETLGCTCGPEYRGRGLYSPDCPRHSCDSDVILKNWKSALDVERKNNSGTLC